MFNIIQSIKGKKGLQIIGFSLVFVGVLIAFFSNIDFSSLTDYSKEEQQEKQQAGVNQKKDEWEIGEIFYEEHGNEKTAILVATIDKWSESVMISRGKWFDFDWECSGNAEDGKMRMLVTTGKISKEYNGNCKDWIELDDNLEAPAYLKFRAKEAPTKVWVKIYSK